VRGLQHSGSLPRSTVPCAPVASPTGAQWNDDEQVMIETSGQQAQGATNGRETSSRRGHLHSLRRDFRRHPVLVVLILGLLLPIGLGVYSGVQAIRTEYHLRAARQALEQPNLNDALAHLTLCLDLSPHSTEAHFLAAQAARRLANYDAAEHHLNECKRLGWSSEAIDLERALSSAQRGSLARVEDFLLSGADKDQPEAILILEALTQGYLKTYRLADALHCLNLWLQRQPHNVRALVWLGEVKERRNSNDEAIVAYRQATLIEPDNAVVRLRLAQALARSDHAEEAQEQFEQLRQRQPDNPEVLLGLARCQRSLGKTEEARQLLDRVLAVDPGPDSKQGPQGLTLFSEALSESGKLALQMGDLEAAEQWLRNAVVRTPYDRDTLYHLYQCLLQRGKGAEARDCLDKVEKLAADRQLLAELTRKITANPKDPALRHEAGLICLRNGQEQEGVRWLLSALVEDPAHRPTHQALAKYYEGIGQARKAADHRHWAGEG
jgi:tetratricopeptide (TPR) repeat protein